MATFSWQQPTTNYNLPISTESTPLSNDEYTRKYIELLAQANADPNNYEVMKALADLIEQGKAQYGMTDADFASIQAMPERAIADALQGAKSAQDRSALERDALDKQHTLEKAAIGAGMANEALNTVIGAAQMASAHKMLKNLRKPKYHTPNVDTQLLNDRIAQAQRLSSGINPMLRSAQVSDLAEQSQRDKALSTSVSGGNSGTYAALMTAAHANRMKAQRANQLMNEQLAQQHQVQLDNLIAAKMANDWKNFEAMKGKFNAYDYPEYTTARQAATLKSSQGLGNISESLASMPDFLGAASQRAADWYMNKNQ